ncbi:hypothetical protein MoryE10_06830 [Methylogaea oryzae]|uniref:Uncharacterized protein n=1 Tax=Methylogaea oryzae TaxID=1295382 RepID=A0A8D4VP32_9GAMM|nr:hypothetical protein MoryE10_06830 [Methylogaea oryzae]
MRCKDRRESPAAIVAGLTYRIMRRGLGNPERCRREARAVAGPRGFVLGQGWGRGLKAALGASG